MSISGKVVWQDLTVPDAGRVAEFYSTVIGWNLHPHDMADKPFCIIKDPAGAVIALIEE